MLQDSGIASTYARAGDLLKGALAKMNDALQALSRTQFMSGMQIGRDIMTPGPGRGRGGMMIQIAEMAIIRRANDQVQSAANDIVAARGLLPSLPQMSEALLKEARMGAFAGFLMGGPGGQMMQVGACVNSGL
jgi:hypothetical protein